MKKLIAMLGAVAMSFGLFAADVATSFEAGDAGVTGGTTWSADYDGSPWTWAAPITLATDGADRTLPYKAAPDPMARYTGFEAGNVNDNYLPLETGKDALTFGVTAGNVVIDQLVKFTGFEEPQVLGDGDKIAVWMSEFPGETDDDPATVNLYVSCGQVGASSTTQYDAIAIEGASLDTWYRLTVKSIGNMYTVASQNREGFVVFINGKAVKSTTTIAPEEDMTADALAAVKAGKLFPAFTASGTEFAQFQQVAYKGIGAIDDFVSTPYCPEFTSAVEATIFIPEGAKASATDANGKEIEIGEGGAIAVEEDAMPITIVFTADDGYVMTPVTKTGVTFEKGQVLRYDDVIPQKAILTVYWDDTTESQQFASLATALAKVQELEQTEELIEIEVGNDAIAAEEIPGYGVLGLSAKAYIMITPADGSWDISGDMTFSGTIAGTVSVTGDVTIPEDGEIILTGEGNLTTATDDLEEIIKSGDTGKKVGKTENDDSTFTYALEDVTYALTLTEGENTTLASDQDDDSKIPAGTTVKVTATPDEDYEFADESYAGWTKEGDNLVKIFTMNGDDEIEGPAATPKATKVDLSFTLPADVAVTDVTGEGVEGNAQDGWKAPADTALTVTVTAQNGKTFADGTTKTVSATASAEAIDLRSVVPAPFAAVAKIGDTAFYATLADAFTAAGTDATITLLADITLSERIFVKNEKVTLDLAGKKIEWDTAVANASGVLIVCRDADLTIDDSSEPSTGVIDAKGKAYAAIAVTHGNDPKNSQTELPATLTVEGGTLKGFYYAIVGNGNRPNTVITVNGGTLEGTSTVAENEGVGIFHPQAGELTINGGTIKGDTGVYIKAGDCICSVGSDATIIATGTKKSYEPTGDGFKSTGDAFVVDTCGYPGGAPDPDIAGGTFISDNAAAVASYAKTDFEPATGFISGGKFKGAELTDTALIAVSDEASKQGKWVEDKDGFLVPDEEPKTFALTLTDNETATLSSNPAATAPITYGTSVTVTAKPEDGYQFVEATAPWVKSGANLVQTFTMTDNVTIEAPTATLIPVVEPVAEIDGKGYPTLQEAFTAAQDGDTVKILKDIEDGNVYVIQCGGAITVDFDGKTVKSTNTSYTLSIKNGTAVTITGNGTLQKYDISQDGTTMVAIDDGSLTLASGTLLARNQASNPVVNVGKGSFTVNGGVVKAAPEVGHTVGPAIRVRGTADGVASAVVNAGEITGPFLVHIQHDDKKDYYGGTITIPATSTATFDRDQTAFCVAGYMTDDSQDGTATPYFVGEKIEITYDYGAGTAPETANKAAFAAYTAARTFTLNVPTGAELETWTADDEGITFAGNVMTIPAGFAKTFKVTATYKQTWPSDWPEADDTVKAKLDGWKSAYGVTTVTAEMADAFLLNVDPEGTIPTLKIDSIEVDAEGYATIEIIAPDEHGFPFDFSAINGVLYIEAGETLDTMAPKAVAYWTTVTGKAIATVKYNFIKAAVGFKKPTVDAVEQTPAAE